MGKKCDLYDLNCSMTIGARWASMSISKIANLLEVSHITDYTEWYEKLKESVGENVVLIRELKEKWPELARK